VATWFVRPNLKVGRSTQGGAAQCPPKATTNRSSTRLMFREADCVLRSQGGSAPYAACGGGALRRATIHAVTLRHGLFQLSPAVALASRPGTESSTPAASTTQAFGQADPSPLAVQPMSRFAVWNGSSSELISRLQAICDRRPTPAPSTQRQFSHDQIFSQETQPRPSALLLLATLSGGSACQVASNLRQEGKRSGADRLQRLAPVWFPWRSSEEKGPGSSRPVSGHPASGSMATSNFDHAAPTPASFDCTAKTPGRHDQFGAWWRRPAGGAPPTTTQTERPR